MRTSEHHGGFNSLALYAETTSNRSQVKRRLSGPLLHSDGSWHFRVPRLTGESLSLLLMKRILFGSNRNVARLILPLEWFPTNRMVREWFQMTNLYGRDGAPEKATILLDVHPEAHGAAPFQAAFSNLRIIPTWPRPEESARECPAPPQVIFVVAEEDRGETHYVAVGTMQYPTQQMLRGSMPPEQYYSQNYYPSVGIASLSGAMPVDIDVPDVLDELNP
jgi:hypothetical protein